MQRYMTAILFVLASVASISASSETLKEKLARVVLELPAVAETGWPQDVSFWVFVNRDVPDTYSKELATLICEVGPRGFVVTIWKGKKQVAKEKCW